MQNFVVRGGVTTSDYMQIVCSAQTDIDAPCR